ncbi:MAG: SDR family NAD(P)-dependent oxidoreductase, partial [Clostridia bacterium]|nr:SDR family NAD(P)-dependent oxidoreductase [Clostridia bacterium]
MERKVCFITGSGSGNGRGMAIRLAEMGYDICLHHSGRDPQSAEETKAIIESKGVACKILVENLSESGAAQRLFEKFRAEYDRLDLFINNSGTTRGGAVMEVEEDVFNTVCNVNFRACYFCVAEAGKFMREKGIEGSIAMIGSNHHEVNFAGRFSIYASFKAAMVRF